MPGGYGAFANAGVFQDNSWPDNNGYVGANVGRLMACGYLGKRKVYYGDNGSTSGSPPSSPFYICPAFTNFEDPNLNACANYSYNLHMRAMGASFEL
ncbi:MAG: hypothetical protein QM770_19185 [Tepidisphaeraceae bacterium]